VRQVYYIIDMKTASLLLLALAASSLGAEEPPRTDTIPLPGGSLKIHFLGHATLMLDYNGWIIHVDPVGAEADYAELPPADLILVTHEHGDHLDPAAVARITRPGTAIVANPAAADRLRGAVALRNGESHTVGSVKIEALPAYNTSRGRDRFHPKGRDNGYLLTIAGKRIYIAGDTEDTPEMKALKNIDLAFLPMNQPYTMTPEQVARAVRAFKPRVLYPYHTGDTDTARLTALLEGKGVEVRVRRLQ
jgi:L-ascorbate metabolism protein UlaG (beta-lactamase superfamily)